VFHASLFCSLPYFVLNRNLLTCYTMWVGGGGGDRVVVGEVENAIAIAISIAWMKFSSMVVLFCIYWIQRVECSCFMLHASCSPLLSPFVQSDALRLHPKSTSFLTPRDGPTCLASSALNSENGETWPFYMCSRCDFPLQCCGVHTKHLAICRSCLSPHAVDA